MRVKRFSQLPPDSFHLLPHDHAFLQEANVPNIAQWDSGNVMAARMIIGVPDNHVLAFAIDYTWTSKSS